jgi:phosphatidylserine/phosphatidylglycerophosphate/cardiolipin synthase-like enzyme
MKRIDPTQEARAGQPEGTLPAFETEEAAEALLLYPKLPAEKLVTRRVSGKIMAYASPDSTYAVTRKLLDSAGRSIVVGIYDFSANYMKEHLKKALDRGVQVSLMLDTNSADEIALLDELRALGATCVRAPSASADNPIAYFGNAHEKIIVVDGEIVMIQSGNWSENSIPLNPEDGAPAGGHFQPGNRDMGLALHSPELAEFFAELVQRDMRLAQGEPPEAAAPATPAEPSPASALFFEAAPPEAPETLFPSLTITPETPAPITPVITPENYFDAARAFLRSATRSIRIEQQYIRGGQQAIESLLAEIAAARQAHPDLEVRVIVSPKYLDGDKREKFLRAMENLGLAFGEGYRFLSLSHFVHCHNKLIVVDGEKTLLGSQNWSTTGVTTNREASLLVENAEIAGYFAGIFDADWAMSQPEEATPEAFFAAVVAELAASAEAAGAGVVQSSLRDYADV